MTITPLRDDIFWVGHVDWQIRDFHGYDTFRGSTYNAYLLRDQKTALIDAVKGPYAEQLLQSLAAAGVSPGRNPLDYVVCNHAEPDHSGALPDVMRAFPEATLLCDAKCRTALGQHFDTSGWKIQVVCSGERVSLGRRTLEFLETPMVHWPESMFTYVPEERLLFSMDAFGQHFASSERFADEVPLATVMHEAKTYYANIIMPYGKAVAPCLAKAAALPIEIIAPSHGLIWRRDLPRIFDAYRDWTACRAQAKVLVLYDTMWESTERMAEAIYEGAAGPGVDVQLIHLRRTTLTQLATEALDAAGIAFGSSTLNRQMMPAAAAALSYLEGLHPHGKAGIAFGSYGWAPAVPGEIQEVLQRIGWEMLGEPIKSQFRPTPEVLEECRAAGQRLAERARAVCPTT